MSERPEDYPNEIEYLQSVIGTYFPIYKTEVNYDIISLYIRVYKVDDIDKNFDKLRQELVPKNYIPYLQEDSGEHIIRIKKQDERSFRGIRTNAALLVVTISTALIAGIFQWSMYKPGGPFFSLTNLINGAIYFTIPLLTILSIHEMGHYFMARYHNIKASLPFFIPAPPPLVTLGAAISIREPIPDNKSLLDLGVAGPIAGFIVAIPVSILGLWLAATSQQPLPTGQIEFTVFQINFPIIMILMARLFPFVENISIHPTLFAGWVGFLVTGLNLLPAGQLDGGHVIRSMFGEYSKYASYAAVGFLVIVGLWKYIGWLLFAFFILFLVGLKHPPPLNDITKLDKKRKAIGVFAIIMLFICFNPVPIEEKTYRYDFDVQLQESPFQNLSLEDKTANYTFTITNTGEPYADDYNISYSISNSTWNSRLSIMNESSEDGEWDSIIGNRTEINLDSDENRTVRLQVSYAQDANARTDIAFKVKSLANGRDIVKNLTAVMQYSYEVNLLSNDIALVQNGTANYTFQINNLGPKDTYKVSSIDISNDSWGVYFEHNGEQLESPLTLNVSTLESEQFVVILYSKEQLENTIEFHLNAENEISANQLKIIKVSIEISSVNSGKTQEFILTGIVIK